MTARCSTHELQPPFTRGTLGRFSHPAISHPAISSPSASECSSRWKSAQPSRRSLPPRYFPWDSWPACCCWSMHGARILFLVFGRLLTLQSSAGFGSLKRLYPEGVLASFGGVLFTFSRSTNHPRPEALALAAFAALAVLDSFLINPLEDNGCTLGMVLLPALVFRTSGVQTHSQGESGMPANARA
jgi:hypothetical protein